MKDRCHNPKNSGWDHYGGRGIITCDRWRYSFENFLADMGERPDGMTIEREDVNGNYEPGNCRWATRKEQNRNRTDSRFVVARGVRLTLGELVEKTGVSRHKFRWALDHGRTADSVLDRVAHGI